MRYLRKTLNYPKRITLLDLTGMMNMIDLVAIGIEIPQMDSGCSLEKKFIELIFMNS